MAEIAKNAGAEPKGSKAGTGKTMAEELRLRLPTALPVGGIITPV